jgi:hypothetical protein
MQHGVRYVGELQVRFAGENREAAMQYMPAARKLMGAVLADASHSGLGVHSLRQTLSDGTHIHAEKIGAINRVTIMPPGGAPSPPPVVPPDDFVVWSRTADLPAGIDPEFPQQILRFDKTGGWSTFFYNSETLGHDEFPGDKGTYGGLFVEGLRRAGNVDWQSARGEVISWYGPSSRYWVDAYVQPRFQFGKFVFMLGEVLLDTDDYADQSTEQEHGPDRYVTGAALKQISGTRWLYTVQSEAADTDLGSGPFDIADMPSVGCPYSREDNPGGIYRYRLLREVDPAGITRLRVIPNSREQLADLEGNHAEPWFFSQSCVRAHCYVLPADGWFMRKFQPGEELVPPTRPALDPAMAVIMPDPAQIFREAVFDEDGGCALSDTTLTVSQVTPTPVHFVADYKGDQRVYGTITDYSIQRFPGFNDGTFAEGHGPIRFALCGTEVGTVNQHWAPSGQPMGALFPNPEQWSSFHLVFADLRTDVMVLRTIYTIDGTPLRYRHATEVYRSGQLKYQTDEVSRRIASPSPLYYGLLTYSLFLTALDDVATAYAPYFYLYGLGVQPVFQSFPPVYYALQVWAGYAPGFMWLPYPAEAYFGSMCSPSPYGTPRRWDDPLDLVSSAAVGWFQGNASDFDDQKSVLGCASTDDAIVVSGYLPVNNNDPENPVAPPIFNGDNSFHHATDSDLPTLTGVDGEWKRYHPVWLLGRPPRAPE